MPLATPVVLQLAIVALAAAAPADPKAAAAATLAKMTLEEKVTMLHGGKAPGQAGYGKPVIHSHAIDSLRCELGPSGTCPLTT